MIAVVFDINTKKIVYAVKDDIHNACVERDMLNASYPMLDQPYAVATGMKSIGRLGYKRSDLKKWIA